MINKIRIIRETDPLAFQEKIIQLFELDYELIEFSTCSASYTEFSETIINTCFLIGVFKLKEKESESEIKHNLNINIKPRSFVRHLKNE